MRCVVVCSVFALLFAFHNSEAWAEVTHQLADDGDLALSVDAIGHMRLALAAEYAGAQVQGAHWNVRYQRARGLELAGWITFGVGLAMIITGVVVGSTSIPDENLAQGIAGIVVGITGAVCFTVGLPLGAVGTVRRLRLMRQRTTVPGA